jgi:hypothetical protein
MSSLLAAAASVGELFQLTHTWNMQSIDSNKQ